MAYMFGSLPQLRGEIWICRHCGQPYEPNRLNQKYCSGQCGRLHRHEEYPKQGRMCPACQKVFIPHRKDMTYCSQSCRKKAYETNKGWNKTKLEWNSLREFVLERDNFTCQDCGKFLMDAGLEAHHIKPLFKSGTNDEGNLITLCHKCHKKRHMKV